MIPRKELSSTLQNRYSWFKKYILITMYTCAAVKGLFFISLLYTYALHKMIYIIIVKCYILAYFKIKRNKDFSFKTTKIQ